jgi:hypothetical protein
MTLAKHAKKELTFELCAYADAEQKKKTRTYTLQVDKGKQDEYDAWWAALTKVTTAAK